jgi:hypothetical protein
MCSLFSPEGDQYPVADAPKQTFMALRVQYVLADLQVDNNISAQGLDHVNLGFNRVSTRTVHANALTNKAPSQEADDLT